MAYVTLQDRGRVVDPVTGGIKRRGAGWGGLSGLAGRVGLGQMRATGYIVGGGGGSADPCADTFFRLTHQEQCGVTSTPYDEKILQKMNGDEDAPPPPPPTDPTTGIVEPPTIEAETLTIVEDSPYVAPPPTETVEAPGPGPAPITPGYDTGGGGLIPTTQVIPMWGTVPEGEDPGAGDLTGGDVVADIDITTQGPKKGLGLVEYGMLGGLGLLIAYSMQEGR